MISKAASLIRSRQLWDIEGLTDPSFELVAIDLETTGLSPRVGRIIEVAAVRFNLKGKTLETFTSLALPDGDYIHSAENVHGITESEVLAAPPLVDVLTSLLSFVAQSPIVVHHLSFEDLFLSAEMRHYDIPATRIDGICTLQAAKFVFPEFRKYNLDELVGRLRLDRAGPSHRALPDTQACAKLFCSTVKVWKAKGSPEPAAQHMLPGFETTRTGTKLLGHPKTAVNKVLSTVQLSSNKPRADAITTLTESPRPTLASWGSGTKPSIAESPKLLIQPTTEQSAILDAFHQGGDIKITAGAGTGKTSTLRMIAESSNARGTYIAFNRAIAMEAKKSFPSNISTSTAHSLAVRTLRSNGNGAVIDKLSRPRLPLRSMAVFLGIKFLRLANVGGQPRELHEAHLIQSTLDMVRNFCHSADERIDIRHFEPTPELDAVGETTNNEFLAAYLLPYAALAWKEICTATGTGINFEHDHYLKLWTLSSPRIGGDGDILLIDESQDLNPALTTVIASQDHLQKIYVGDANQAIYGFTGAIDALSTFATAHTLSLTQSWRFGDSIAAVANGWLQDLGSKLQLSGNPSRGSRLTGSESADAVLCRTNATAVGEVMRAHEQQISVALTGGADNALWFVRDVQKLKDGHRPSHRDLSAFSTWADVIEYVQYAGKTAHEMTTWVALINGFGEHALAQALTALKPEQSARVTVSTVHKAKGREWDTVRIAPDFTIKRHADVPSDIEGAKTVRAEQMLAYVAVTRARSKLNPGVLIDGPPLSDEEPAITPITVTLSADQQKAFAAKLGTDFTTWLSQQS